MLNRTPSAAASAHFSYAFNKRITCFILKALVRLNPSISSSHSQQGSGKADFPDCHSSSQPCLGLTAERSLAGPPHILYYFHNHEFTTRSPLQGNCGIGNTEFFIRKILQDCFSQKKMQINELLPLRCTKATLQSPKHLL